jgi:hypothetical protein
MLASIRGNHYMRLEFQRTSTAQGIKWSFILMRVIPLVFLALVALIPTQVYINDNLVDLLPLMAIVLFMPRPILAIRTIFVGIHSVRQDMVEQRWELLVLTGIPARKIVWGKWINVVKQSSLDQIIFALPALGLAMGISQFFLSTNYTCYISPYVPLKGYMMEIDAWLSPYCHNSDMYYAFQSYPLNPSTTVATIGLVIIIFIATLEVGLNASIGILAGFSRISAKGLALAYGVIIRVIFLLVIGFILPIGYGWFGYKLVCQTIPSPNICMTISYVAQMASRKGAETLQLAVMPLLDQGTLLAANIMRPNDDRWLEFGPYDSEPQLTYVRKSHYDNRPFVLRNISAAMISVFFYWLLIRYFLRRATRFAIVNHGASGYIEL